MALLLTGLAVGALAAAIAYLLVADLDAAALVGLLHAAVTWAGLALDLSDRHHPEES